jgi:hypothetical protein
VVRVASGRLWWIRAPRSIRCTRVPPFHRKAWIHHAKCCSRYSSANEGVNGAREAAASAAKQSERLCPRRLEPETIQPPTSQTPPMHQPDNSLTRGNLALTCHSLRDAQIICPSFYHYSK